MIKHKLVREHCDEIITRMQKANVLRKLFHKTLIN